MDCQSSLDSKFASGLLQVLANVESELWVSEMME